MFRRHLASLVLLGAILAGCATPVPPSGGPVDRSPPRILSTDPVAGSVRVSGSTVRIDFGDWMDENSLERSLTISPELDTRPAIRWRRRSVEIVFPEEFRPNTTYVLTFDRNLRTFRGGTLDQPLSIAFATGDQIDRGRLTGLVVDPLRGDAVQGMDVFAYPGQVDRPDAPPPAALPDRPAYRTQTGSDGTFSFDYVAEGPYFILALEDANRNRRLDPGEAFAVPPEPWIIADSAGFAPDKPWIRTLSDTLAPELNRIRSLSARHLELRFNEDVVLPDREADDYILSPVEGAAPPAVADVFSRAADRRFVYLVLSGNLAQGRYRLSAPPVADTSGNLSARQVLEFDAAPSPDTLRQQFVEFLPDTSLAGEGWADLLAWQRPGFRLHMPESASVLENAVILADTAGVPRSYSLVSLDGTTYRIEPDPPPAEGETLEVTVRLNGIKAMQRFRRLDESEVGEVSGSVLAGPEHGSFVVELYATDLDAPLRSLTLTEAGTFMFEGLPEGEYRIRAFVDLQGDGQWDGGAPAPFRPAAPMRWVPQVVSVRPRWETALSDPISFAAPPEVPAEQPEDPIETDADVPVFGDFGES